MGQFASPVDAFPDSTLSPILTVISGDPNQVGVAVVELFGSDSKGSTFYHFQARSYHMEHREF